MIDFKIGYLMLIDGLNCEMGIGLAENVYGVIGFVNICLDNDILIVSHRN